VEKAYDGSIEIWWMKLCFYVFWIVSFWTFFYQPSSVKCRKNVRLNVYLRKNIPFSKYICLRCEKYICYKRERLATYPFVTSERDDHDTEI
jgi:hypothetical protein